MATYYIAYSDEDGTLACEFSKAKAIKFLQSYYGKSASKRSRVDAVTLGCTAREAVRRLLGNHGGYAGNTETVWPESERTI